ncbi:hypothetical protein WJX77_009542 [Trebouxia sp. C0004]
MNLNMHTVRSYLGQAAQTAKELSSQAAVAAKDLSFQVVGAKCLREYTVQGLTGSAGPSCMWKIFAARSRKEGVSNPSASVWILDKRSVTDASKGNPKIAEAFLQLCRKDAASLAKLKHPHVVRLLEPFEENRSQLVMVTEAVTASVADVLRMRKVSAVGSSVAGSLQLSELEIKHGFLQVADGLHFLHSQANQIHRGISPEAICITAGGAWKLAGFGFAMLAEFSNSNPAEAAFDYSDTSNCLAQSLRPGLSYTAPELVVGDQQSVGSLFSAADIFTLGIVMYEVIAGKQLLDVGQSIYDYRSKISAFQQVDLSAVSYELQTLLGPMLSLTPAARPSAISITGSQYFQGDVMLRALRFMDSMIQRDTMQKAAFLNDLTTFWHKFDDRVLRLKVLPHLLEEARSEQLQQLVLPLVIHILGKQDKQDFADTSAPALRTIFQSAKGDSLLLLVRCTPSLMKSMPRPFVTSMMLPLLLRAAQQGDPRCQDEMLKQLPTVAEQTEYTTLKSELLPRMHSLCLKTTSASVRVNSLTCMGRIAARLDEDEAGKMLQTASKVSAVDHTAPTVMCVLALGDAISKQYGLGIAAKEVLPLLTPLLVLPALSGPQFSQAMGMVKSILGQIESKRARELEVLDSAALSAVNTTRPSSNPSSLTGGMTSWDTSAMPYQAALGTRSPASTARLNPHPASQPSWHNSKPIAAVRDMPSSAGPSDPFAVLPATQAAKPSHEGGANDLLSGSLFGPASTSYERPKPQAPHPGDQLANVMSNDRIDALFMDPSWTDPDLGGPARGMGMGQGGPPRLAQSSLPSMQSSAAADPFSQLSLSRCASGGTASNRPAAVPTSSTVIGIQGSGVGLQWKNQTATKGLIPPITVGGSQGPMSGRSQRPGSMATSRPSSNQNQQFIQHQQSLI